MFGLGVFEVLILLGVLGVAVVLLVLFFALRAGSGGSRKP